MALVKYNNNSISAVTALDSIPSGDLVLLATNNITSGVASSSFTSNIDSTYNTYFFKFINMHPANNSVYLQVNFSTDGGSNYNVTKTTTYFHAYQNESGSANNLNYDVARDLAQSTAYQDISYQTGNADDESCSGTLVLFAPSSTTYVKHFITNIQSYSDVSDDYTINSYTAGYGNTTSAVDAIDFKFSSGNIDSGVIKMYGLRES